MDRCDIKVRVPQAVKQWLAQEADFHMVSMNAVVLRIVRDEIKRQQIEQRSAQK